MGNNKDYSHLLDRIRRLDVSTIESMSPDVMANLTDGFKELLIKELLYTGTMNHEQRKIIRAVKTAYKNWKKDTDQFWGNPPLYPERYPEYMEDLQMDIECGWVVTAKGSFEEAHARLKVSSILSEAVPIKPFPKADQSNKQTNKDADDKDKIIAELREKVEQLEREHEETLVALLKPAFYNIEDDVRDFLRRIQGLDNMGVASVARQFVKEKKIIPRHKKTFIWKILNAAKLYDATQQNWGQQMDIKD